MNTEWLESAFEQFEKSLNGQKEGTLHQVRKSALEAARSSGLPTTKLEEWKYTNLAPLEKENFSLPVENDSALTETEVSQLLPFTDCRLVFIDGSFSQKASKIPSGLALKPLREVRDKQDLSSHLKRLERSGETSLLAINTAFLQEGFLLEVEGKLEVPVYCVFLTRKGGQISQPRIIVELEEQAQASLIEHYIGSSETQYVTNIVSDYALAAGARLDVARLQEEGSKATHLAQIYLEQEKESTCRICNLFLGAQLSRTEVRPVLKGSDIHSEISALNVGRGQQHHDIVTEVDHAEPECESFQNFKGIYTDDAKGVFTGTIIVRPDAQRTNAIQSSQGLLLSDKASLDTRPQLKIWADDVKCTHGATVGQLDEQALFYLKSRGLDHDTASRLLVQAFAGDVFTTIDDEAIKEVFIERMVSSLPVAKQ